MIQAHGPKNRKPRWEWESLFLGMQKAAAWDESQVVRDTHGRFAEKFTSGLKTTMTLAPDDIIVDPGFGKAKVLDVTAYTRTKPMDEQKLVVELPNGERTSIIAKPDQKWNVMTAARQKQTSPKPPPKLAAIKTTADKVEIQHAIRQGEHFADELERKSYDAVEEYGGAEDEALKTHVMRAVTTRWIGSAPQDIREGMRVEFDNPRTGHILQGTVVHVSESVNRGNGPSWALGTEGANAPIIRVRADVDAVTGETISGEDGGIIGVSNVRSLEPLDPDVNEVIKQVTKEFNDDVYWPYGRGDNKQAITAHLISMWAASSSDGNVLSVMLQEAISEEFGIPETDFLKESFDRPPTTSDTALDAYADTNWLARKAKYDRLEANPSFKAGLRKFVRAQYEETQAWLEQIGVDEMMVYRGFDWNQSSRPDWIPDGDAVVKADMNPASSFSSDFGTAKTFAGGGAWYRRENTGGGSLGAAIVPRDRIFSVPGAGIGALSESEVVVLGGKDQELFMWTWLRGVDEMTSLVRRPDYDAEGSLPKSDTDIIEAMRRKLDPDLQERKRIEDNIRLYFRNRSPQGALTYFAIDTHNNRMEVSKQSSPAGGSVDILERDATEIEQDMRSFQEGNFLPNDVTVSLVDGKLVFYWPERLDPTVEKLNTLKGVRTVLDAIEFTYPRVHIEASSPNTGVYDWTITFPDSMSAVEKLQAMNLIRQRFKYAQGIELRPVGGGEFEMGLELTPLGGPDGGYKVRLKA